MASSNGMLMYDFELPLRTYQTAHPFWLSDFYMETVGGSCQENLVVTLACVAQILQLYQLFSPLPTLPLVSYLSLSDMVDHE